MLGYRRLAKDRKTLNAECNRATRRRILLEVGLKNSGDSTIVDFLAFPHITHISIISLKFLDSTSRIKFIQVE